MVCRGDALQLARVTVPASQSNRPSLLPALAPADLERFFHPDDLATLMAASGWLGHPRPLASWLNPTHATTVARTEVLLIGWGAPVIDRAVLDAMPRLRLILFAGGTIRTWITDAVWDRGITVGTAQAANAESVAEFALGAVLLSLKHVWHHASRHHRGVAYRHADDFPAPPGAFRRVVGLVSYGAIARRLHQLLRPFELEIWVHDPFVPDEEIVAAGAAPAALPKLFAGADVVSLHTPHLPKTEGMIDAGLVAIMKRGATLLNTARGALLREDELANVLRLRPDLQAVLDVLWPEPPAPDNRLLELPNVTVTPHIAGSLGNECQRFGQHLTQTFNTWVETGHLPHGLTRERAALLA